MQQNVNLYLSVFRRERRIFSGRMLLAGVGVVAAALLVIYAWGYRQVRVLEAELVQLEGREKAFAAQLARLGPDSVDPGREIDAELERLTARLLEQQKLVDILETRPLGTTEGFSAQLAALARQHTDGLWLTRMAIAGSAARLELAGVSVSPELVPEYLRRLGTEPALSGQRFDVLTIERREDESTVSFRVSSHELDEAFARQAR